MSKKKVIAIYPDATCIVGISGTGADRKNTYTITIIGAELSHVCSSRQSAWRSALARIEGRVSYKKGENKPDAKVKMYVRLPHNMKERIEKLHGSIQAFINHHAAKLK